MLLIGTPLSDYMFDSPIRFDSGGTLFDFLPDSNIGMTDTLTYYMPLNKHLVSKINVITTILRSCFGFKTSSEVGMTDELLYSNNRGVVGRWRKIYSGFEKNQDSPTPLFGVS